MKLIKHEMKILNECELSAYTRHLLTGNPLVDEVEIWKFQIGPGVNFSEICRRQTGKGVTVTMAIKICERSPTFINLKI